MQTANSALSRNITGDTLVSVQVKGRDVFGMMKILPGVMDSHRAATTRSGTRAAT